MPARRVKGPDQPLGVKELDCKRAEDAVYSNMLYLHDMADAETSWMAYTLANHILSKAVSTVASGGAPGTFRPIFDRLKATITSR